jgi:RecG-like helicase
MFQNNTTLSGYRLKVFSFSAPFDINLDELDFKYTLQFLKIIDKANTVEVIGTVRIINDIESVKRNGLPNYDKQIIIVYIDNGHGTELRIVFLHQKVQLLKNLKVGQEIKIYTELLGGKDESVNFGYSLQIRGWDLEILKN